MIYYTYKFTCWYLSVQFHIQTSLPRKQINDIHKKCNQSINSEHLSSMVFSHNVSSNLVVALNGCSSKDYQEQEDCHIFSTPPPPKLYEKKSKTYPTQKSSDGETHHPQKKINWVFHPLQIISLQ